MISLNPQIGLPLLQGGSPKGISLAGTSAPTSFSLTSDKPASAEDKQAELEKAFQQFVAGTFYKQMMKALRSSTGKAAYFHGGQSEKIFQNQMDDIVTDSLAEIHGKHVAAPLLELYKLQRAS